MFYCVISPLLRLHIWDNELLKERIISLEVWIFHSIVSWPIDFETVVGEQLIAEASAVEESLTLLWPENERMGKDQGWMFSLRKCLQSPTSFHHHLHPEETMPSQYSSSWKAFLQCLEHFRVLQIKIIAFTFLWSCDTLHISKNWQSISASTSSIYLIINF